VEEIRVLLALVPLLADLVDDMLAADPSIRVVGRVDAKPELDLEQALSIARSTRAHVVLLGAERGETARVCDALFDARPRLKIVSLDDDGREGVACELAPRVTRLGALRPETLLNAIHEVTSHTWEEAWAT
jgi:DNA-binding NarL/FixJ family response regulator